MEWKEKNIPRKQKEKIAETRKKIHHGKAPFMAWRKKGKTIMAI